ncbi:YigZ family protein [Flavobacteriaceae bacterium F89]|uniref:YigZ family protein n=1 Tax=Cerina litoralis TaxID=2874477 RepID=A0AAE3EUD6_9FLAO|nr:YigZ family protein [Cerina litoralis]MCG2461093.1 YigZ family protein [Cerina litoralis]
MENQSGRFKTIETASPEVLYKERKSKFFAYAFPLYEEEDVKPRIDSLRKMHPAANHVCYAWQIGISEPRYRANDDGEPNNSAGMPIYGQLQSFGVTNILVAVARVFGGTKLGVGGLINAYRTAAQLALEASTIIEKSLEQRFLLSFGYDQMNTVMRTLKQRQINIESQKMGLDCQIFISVEQHKAPEIIEIFKGFHKIGLKSV